MLDEQQPQLTNLMCNSQPTHRRLQLLPLVVSSEQFAVASLSYKCIDYTFALPFLAVVRRMVKDYVAVENAFATVHL